MTEASAYFLTEEELRAGFEEQVKDFVFSGYKPQVEPVLVLLGGQPAAGKSQAMAATQQRHSGGNLVPLTGDELRFLHPRYPELLQVDAQTREAATAQASGAWVRMSIEHARKQGYSLILEGVFRDPDMTIGTAETFARAGSKVELVALAVREERSRLDAVDRFLDGGRWTPPALQDLAYEKVPETVARAQASPAVRGIVITNRTGADLHVNERDHRGEWVRPPDAVQAIAVERAKPFTPEQATEWLSMHRTVTVEMAARGEVKQASRPVLERLAHDADRVALMAAPDAASLVRIQHEASKRILHALISEPVAGQSLPAPLRPGAYLSFDKTDMAERQIRTAQPPVVRTQEEQLRGQFAAARQRYAERQKTTGPAERDASPTPPHLSNSVADAARMRSSAAGRHVAPSSATDSANRAAKYSPPDHNPGRSR